MLDIGGESTRPGSLPISPADETARVLPVVTALLKATDVPISIDTSKAEVARACLEVGRLHIINDVTGLAYPRMVETARAFRAGLIAMHMQGTPATMQAEPKYDDVVGDLFRFFTDRLQSLKDAGIDPNAIAIDPGIGFGKTRAHNIALLARLAKFRELDAPICLGVSRKGFLGKLLDRPGRRTPRRLVGGRGVCIVARGGANLARPRCRADARPGARLGNILNYVLAAHLGERRRRQSRLTKVSG